MLLMLNGRFWAVSELFSAIGESFGGSKTKGKGQRQKPAQRRPSGKSVVPDQPQAAAIRKARMRGMLSAIEQGALRQK
jgi:hypothetical protein